MLRCKCLNFKTDSVGGVGAFPPFFELVESVRWCSRWGDRKLSVSGPSLSPYISPPTLQDQRASYFVLESLFFLVISRLLGLRLVDSFCISCYSGPVQYLLNMGGL